MGKNDVSDEHICTIPPWKNPVIKYICNGSHVYWRRKFRKWCIVSETNRRARVFFKSSASIYNEQKRQLHFHYHMIHPFSDFRAIWETMMIFVYCISFYLIPVCLTLMNTDIKGVYYVKYSMDQFCIVDIVLNFFTGYYKYDTKEIILNSKMVACYYVKRLFLFDVVASIPFEVMLEHGETTMSLLKILRFLQVFRILRIYTMFQYIERFIEWQNLNTYIMKVVNIILSYSLVAWWIASLMYLKTYLFKRNEWGGVSTLERIQWFSTEGTTYTSQIIHALFRVIHLLSSVGDGYMDSTSLLDLVLTLIFVFIGFTARLSIIAHMLKLLMRYNCGRAKYKQLVQQVEEYMRYKELPLHVRKRIMYHYQFLYQKRYFRQAEIMELLSDHLREEVNLQICRSLVESVSLFQDMPVSVISRLVKRLKMEIFLPNDVIVYAGTTGDSMMFIASGTVAVYLKNGVELCHLEDGAHFGELTMVYEGEPRIATVVALEACEMFVLERKDFQKAFELYPEMMERILSMAKSRLQKSREVLGPTPSNHSKFVI